LKPAWQPQPAPPAQVVPGVMQGRNGRPPGQTSQASTPLPQAGQVSTQRPPAVAPSGGVTYAFKVASPIYPDVNQGHPTFNPVTGEWILPRG
jgi:hypothetical protein